MDEWMGGWMDEWNGEEKSPLSCLLPVIHSSSHRAFHSRYIPCSGLRALRFVPIGIDHHRDHLEEVTDDAEVGEGNLNWEGILAEAKEAGVEWYVVEQDLSYDRDPFESLRISLENLNAMGVA